MNATPARIVRALWQRLRRPLVWRRRLLYDQSLTQEFPSIEPRIPIQWVVRDHPDWVGRKLSPRAPAEPSITLHAIHNGVEIYHSEVITDPDYIRRYFPACQLGRRPVYHGDAVTLPEYRGNLLHPAGMAWVFRYYKERGYDQVLARVRPDNDASLSGMRRAGYHLRAEAHHIALLGFELPPIGRRLRDRAAAKAPRTARPDGTRGAA